MIVFLMGWTVIMICVGRLTVQQVTKKSVRGLYLLLVPRIEALACAHLSRTSNAEPHAV